MAREVLIIPEASLNDVIIIIRNGLNWTSTSDVSPIVAERLSKWCDEQEAYLKDQFGQTGTDVTER